MSYFPSQVYPCGLAWYWTPGPDPNTFTLHKNFGPPRTTFNREQLRAEVIRVKYHWLPISQGSYDMRDKWLAAVGGGLKHLFNEVAA